MNISLQTQAILLLTARFSKLTPRDPKPLTATEWGRFAQWLKEQGSTPEMLLTTPDPLAYLQGWADRHITQERLTALLSRSAVLGFALEKWQRSGLWVITRSDAAYPTRLKRRLKFDAPPLLFGCGNSHLLEQGGLAVIGSRDATPDDLAYATKLGVTGSSQGYTIISGGARGVDEAAMMGALAQQGTVVGVLADSLLRTATSAKYRQGLLAQSVVLISPFYPETGFEVGNAMARNKYIYCLADAAIVVATGKEQGGTWHGATENLKQGWAPLWIKPHPNVASGNAALVAKGGRWLPDGPIELSGLLNSTETDKPEPVMASLFELPPANGTNSTVAEPTNEAVTATEPLFAVPVETKAEVDTDAKQLSFYEFFLLKLGATINGTPATPDAIQEQLQISKSQLNEWLLRAVTEERVIKLNKPVRYQLVSTRQGQLDL